MKKILIFSHALELGGAERSLLGLLEAIDKTKYQVDLFLMRHEGELLPLIPGGINLLPEVPAYTVLARPMANTLKEGHLLLTSARLLGKMAAAHYAKKYGHQDSMVALEYSHKYTRRFMPAIQPDTEYDLAISFLTPHYFVAEKIRAKKKIAWIHTDYAHIDVDLPSELAMWAKYDYIASISDSVTNSFIKKFPALADKIILIENILSEKLIHTDSPADISAEMPADSAIRLLSIGRFSNAKNFDNVPDICKRLIEMGLSIKWYLIGYGGDEALIHRKIVEAGMEDHVIILGKKDNPYPYVAACDLYVQPSRYEGKCVAVREAQMLCKPIVITNYATSASQLADGVDGIIVPMDNEGCAKGIAALLCNPEKMTQLSANCRERDYSNAQEIEKLYRLMEM